MPTRRSRTPSSDAWPRLSILAVYSASPILEPADAGVKLSDEQLEARRVLYLHRSHDADRARSGAEEGREADLTPEEKRRMLGTVLGVADFAKMMSGPSALIRSVKSSRRRMVWIEPERGIFVHATIAIPRHSSSSSPTEGGTAQPRQHVRELSTATSSTSRSGDRHSRIANNADSLLFVDDDLFIATLEAAHSSYRLQHGSLRRTLDRNGKRDAVEKLHSFWTQWLDDHRDRLVPTNVGQFAVDTLCDPLFEVIGGIHMSRALSQPPVVAQLVPLLAQLEASNPGVSPILLDQHGHLLYAPRSSRSPSPPRSSSSSNPSTQEGEPSPTTTFILDSTTVEALVRHVVHLRIRRRRRSSSVASATLFPDHAELPTQREPITKEKEIGGRGGDSSSASLTAPASNWTTSALAFFDPRNVLFLPSSPSSTPSSSAPATASTSSSFLSLNPFTSSSPSTRPRLRSANPTPTTRSETLALRNDFAQLKKHSRSLTRQSAAGGGSDPRGPSPTSFPPSSSSPEPLSASAIEARRDVGIDRGNEGRSAAAVRSKKEGSTSTHRSPSRSVRTEEIEDQAPGDGERGGGSGSGWGLRAVSRSWSRLGSAFAAVGGAGAGEAGTAALTDRTNPSPSETTVVETDAAPNVSAGPTRGDGSPEIAAAPAAASSLTPTPETRAARGAGGDETPGTPAIELDPEVNEADLVEALEAIDLADATHVGDTTDAGASTVSQKAQRDDGPVEMRIPEDGAGGTEEEERNVDDGHDGTRAPVFLELFGGANEDKLNVRLVERRGLLLALASFSQNPRTSSLDFDLLCNRANRLLEAVETILENSTDATASASSTSTPFVSIKADGHVYSGTTSVLPPASEAPIPEASAETAYAVLEAQRALDSKPLGILESLSRLPTSSNWLSIVRSNLGIDLVDSPRPPSRRAEQAPSSSPSSREISAQVDEGEANESNRVEVVAVLPAKNQRGRETTLVEAAEGARRIERKWIAHERAI